MKLEIKKKLHKHVETKQNKTKKNGLEKKKKPKAIIDYSEINIAYILKFISCCYDNHQREI